MANIEDQNEMTRFTHKNCFLILLLLSSCVLAQEVTDPEVVHPNQRVTVQNLAPIRSADASRAAVARAAVDIVLNSTGVKCVPGSQVDSVVEANADASLRTLATKMSGSSCAMNGRTVHLTVTFVPNGAIQGNNVIAALMHDTPLLFEWKDALYVLYGVVYDQHLGNSGRQNNIIREFMLIDARYSDKRRHITFDRERNDFAEVGGLATVSIDK